MRGRGGDGESGGRERSLKGALHYNALRARRREDFKATGGKGARPQCRRAGEENANALGRCGFCLLEGGGDYFCRARLEIQIHHQRNLRLT